MHAGGVGLCEYVQHLAAWDYIACSGSLENRVLEYVDHLHEHFLDPVRIRQGRYLLPEKPGYSIQMKAESLAEYAFPEARLGRRKYLRADCFAPRAHGRATGFQPVRGHSESRTAVSHSRTCTGWKPVHE